VALRFIPDLHRATHRVAVYLARARDLGVTQGEAHVLAHLHAAGESTIAELHRAFAHKRSTLTSILDRLAVRGLVVREASERDRRTFVVRLTKEGRRLAARAHERLEAFEARALKRVTREQLAGFAAVVAAVEKALDDEL
jgi:DNA-binding MarR family transcriptional regulator